MESFHIFTPIYTYIEGHINYDTGTDNLSDNSNFLFKNKCKKTTAKSDMEEEKAGWKTDEASKW